jgi:hypothetical protein
MPPRALDDHHVAIDDRAVVEKASLKEVVDEIVLVQGVLIVALSGMAERGRSGWEAGPPDEIFIATNSIAMREWLCPEADKHACTDSRCFHGKQRSVGTADRIACTLALPWAGSLEIPSQGRMAKADKLA